MQVFMKCPTCKQEYELGVTGTTAGCDVCQGIVRASNGFVIFPKPADDKKENYKAQNEKAPAR